MQYVGRYTSPLGDMVMAADGEGLIGLWFEGQKYFGSGLGPEREEKEVPVLEMTRRWLDMYFTGQEPDFSVPLHLLGTEFRREVWQILLTIPYGRTMTYGDMAAVLARKRGKPVSPRAVGGAVGHNPVSLLVPCHRAVGAKGNLTGYAGGLDRKIRLLTLEKADRGPLFMPRKENKG